MNTSNIHRIFAANIPHIHRKNALSNGNVHLRAPTLDVVKSSEIEGEWLNYDQVRSSIARRLGINTAGLVPSSSHIEGVVEILF